MDAATGETAVGDVGIDITSGAATNGDVDMGDVGLKPENNAGVEEEASCPEAARESSIVRALLAREETSPGCRLAREEDRR